MPADMKALAEDAAGESAALRGLVAWLDEPGWQQPTPADGWSIADQVGHLAYFDDVAVRSATRPAEFEAEAAQVAADGGISPDRIAAQYRNRSGADLLAWFGRSRAALISAFQPLDPALRVPWFGPPMSAASALTARIMETWAHGQDIADALGVAREPTARLRHVAHLGVRAMPFSFRLHRLDVPPGPVRVELAAPGGGTWTWGPADAADRVAGPAVDFCLVVTQRRHPADTSLAVTGPVAAQWLPIAQAFAGPPGPGRRPGQSG